MEISTRLNECPAYIHLWAMQRNISQLGSPLPFPLIIIYNIIYSYQRMQTYRRPFPTMIPYSLWLER
jgi:hypothetical protein